MSFYRTLSCRLQVPRLSGLKFCAVSSTPLLCQMSMSHVKQSDWVLGVMQGMLTSSFWCHLCKPMQKNGYFHWNINMCECMASDSEPGQRECGRMQ